MKKTISNCRSCWSNRLIEFMNLGEQYTSDFRKDTSKPPKYPLTALICKDCFLVQLSMTVPSGEMYHENYGFKSGVSNSIKDDLKEVVSTALEYHENPRSWLDIASNDGTLLSYVPNSIYRAGVDPIYKYCKEAIKHADYIVNDFFYADQFAKPFDIITSISCFYDMDRPNEFVQDVSHVIKDDGIWVIQQNYLLPTIEYKAVDNFCHEHLEYYTLLSLEPLLERHGFEVIDLSTSMVNGGSLRTIVAKKGKYPIAPVVEEQREIEKEAKLDSFQTYRKFAREVKVNLDNLRTLLEEIKDRKQTVYILAASTRGATIWQTAGIDDKLVEFAVERNPEKVGKYFSAIGVPIISEEEAHRRNPDYMLIGPWFFAKEILEREADYIERGGKCIIPLPNLQIVG